MRISDTNLDLDWLGHSGFRLKNSKVIYIDPYNIKEGLEKADIILITHDHYDHCSIEDLNKIIQDGTKILCTADCQSKIAKFEVPIKLEVVHPNQEIDLGTIKISTMPAYNIDKEFHPREAEGVGYVIKIEGIIIYHAGDTDKIDEMQKLTGHQEKFIALLPIGGRFTMTPEEAAEATHLIKPNIAIPMHYGSIVGTTEDANEFVQLCKEYGIDSHILEKI